MTATLQNSLVKFPLALVLLLTLCLGCQKGGNTVVPDPGESGISGENGDILSEESLTPGTHSDDRSSSSDGKWQPVGAFDFTFDPETETLVYERNADTWIDVTDFLLSPACPGCFTVAVTSWDPVTCVLAFDTTIKNPTEIEIGAVRAVLCFPNDKFRLDDPDLYHDWYSDGQGPEYDPVRSLVDYCINSPGNYSPFQPLDEVSRSWVLHFPTEPGESFKFQFVIEIYWPGELQEPYRFRFNGMQPEGILHSDGGEIKFYPRIYDLQDDIAGVEIDTDVFGMGVVELTQIDDDDWMAVINNQAQVEPGIYPLLITATDSVSDKKVHFYYDVTVYESGTIIDPQLEMVWNLWPNYPPGNPSSSNRSYLNDSIFWVQFHEEGWLSFDISDPSNPLPMGTPHELIEGLGPVGNPGLEPWAVGSGFAIWRGEYPPAPRQTRVYNLDGGPIPDISSPDYIVTVVPGVNHNGFPVFSRVFGTIAVIFTGDEFGKYLALLDLSDPDNPIYTEIFGPGDFSKCLDLTDDWILASDYYNLTVYPRPSSIGDPPSLEISLDEICHNAFFVGNYLYYNQYPYEDQILYRWEFKDDVWTQLAPVEIVSPGQRIRSGVGIGQRRYHYIYDGHNFGLAVFDFTDPKEPTLENIYWGREYIPFLVENLPPDLLITGYGDYMLPSMPHSGGIWLRDPDNPEIVLGQIDYEIDGIANSIDVVDGIAAIAEGAFGLIIADISALPEYPTMLSRIEAGSGPNMFVKLHKSTSGLTAYTLSADVGVVVCDLSVPESPVETVILDHTSARCLDCNDQFLMIGTATGVEVYELSDPLSPSYVGTLTPMDNLDGPVWDVDIQENSLWTRVSHAIVRYDLDSGWPFNSESRTDLPFTVGWMEAGWPYLIDGGQSSDSNFGPWVYPIDSWLDFNAQKISGNSYWRIAYNDRYLFRQRGQISYPFMDEHWATLIIYDWDDFNSSFSHYPDYSSYAVIPDNTADGLTIWGGPEFIKKGNRIYMSRGRIDLVVVRLW